jgi:hypothetical protein
MERSNFVIELMNIPLDAALFDGGRLLSEELAELTVPYIYSLSSQSPPHPPPLLETFLSSQSSQTKENLQGLLLLE